MFETQPFKAEEVHSSAAGKFASDEANTNVISENLAGKLTESKQYVARGWRMEEGGCD